MCKLMVVITFEKFPALISANISSAPFSLFFLDEFYTGLCMLHVDLSQLALVTFSDHFFFQFRSSGEPPLVNFFVMTHRTFNSTIPVWFS
jgi:hypothetical protein